MREKNFLKSVKAQYEELPYPPRNPENEEQRLLHKIGDNLIILNHHCFGGSRDFSSDFRVLVAGGGTGDATIYLAEQLRSFEAEVVYVDLSQAAMEIAKERARIRGLKNIRWINESIMDLPTLDLGRFDYISCTGVLHHLESAEDGLKALKDVLDDDGVILLMLYGKYGRRAIYDMQELLRGCLPPTISIQEKVEMTRDLLNALPSTNSFVCDFNKWRLEISEDGFGDAGLYDLLLHSKDRCFDVGDLYDLAASAELELLNFVDRPIAYNPFAIVPEGPMSDYLRKLEKRKQQAIAERMNCDLSSHEFYLGHQGRHKEAQLEDEDNTLVMVGLRHNMHREIGEGLVPGSTITFSGRGGDITITGNEINRVLLANMDGQTPIRRIYKRARKSLRGVSKEDLKSELFALYGALHSRGYLFLLSRGSHGRKVPDYTLMQPP